ncbi:MAG: 16S rRNA (adenine(1518)-N(6)/adenine(1519)-N(6))-dimethyltransferase RsmA [Spirochaetes bacterium]|jgi:16S rRNA (adenine1518-N6/adenine1519-N6)-dimethyltransferase|nr:16S rRNA (adenine(1518)-N(6)/adenine(1519)-N(6))-dimethyltransferase RsmA [Spirochaetota bacterium]
MNKEKITSLLDDYGLRPSKRFGQNFLINDEITRKIVAAAELDENAAILEIGPGLGCMTQYLLETGFPVTAVEIDRGYVSVLNDLFAENQEFRLIHADFLKLTEKISCTHVIANLPYYCASELLFRVIDFQPGTIAVMLQKEMAERINALPGSKTYGMLTVNLNLHYHCTEIFTVGKSNFYPRPDIDSAVIVLKRRSSLVLPEDLTPLFKQVTKTLFWGRRKSILKCLTSSPHILLERSQAQLVINRAGLPELERAENLTIENFVSLTENINEIRKP